MRYVEIAKEINARMVADHRLHINVISTVAEYAGQNRLALRFVSVDTPKYMEYVLNLVAEYENLVVVRQTKTTLVAAYVE